MQSLAGALTLMLLTLAAHAENFIRIDEDKSAARLQTAVTRYAKGRATVDLIGAIHIADKAYYQTLNSRFKSYDVLLFEMIGGEKIAAIQQAPPKPPAPVDGPKKKEQDLSGLRKLYTMIANALNLTGQADWIDYTAKNFVHADLTLAEFNRLQQQRGESLLGFVLKSSVHQPKADHQPDAMKLLKGLISGNSNVVKLEIIHTLGQSEDQIASLSGASVIINDRNQRCLEVMNHELATGHKHLGIFYGAAHFPDMEKRLLDQGFKQVNREWLTAWNIPKITTRKIPPK